MDKFDAQNSLEGIAIIGMAGRFPGAKNVDNFWDNLRNGVESISFFSEEELESLGIDPAVIRQPNYVKAKPVLEDIELFDAAFFGFNPRETEITDPQHRFFLECAWEALESAGYNSEAYKGSIGVYAGVGGINTYLLNNLYSNHDLRESVGDYQMMIANDKDFLATRVAYKLNLNGSSVTVQTACSTSLVAICMASQSLLNYQCDIALAGGVSISVPQKTGYLYREGMIFSPDGHCRAFDAKAKGTILGSGVGIVVLKRLEEAIADKDYIHAVIKGLAINNDGANKVGYTAPSVDGQAAAIAQALAFAEVEPETVTYIEAHGTGTPLGDPIEIAALTQAFRASTQKKGFCASSPPLHTCAIGSVKTNIGHLDTAAGVTGLIKTVQALKHKLIPPSLHFEVPNPEIDFANSPFYVNTKLSEWKTNGSPRRAGVSSFGIGGTNAHVVLEEAPVVETSGESRPWQLLAISAKTSTALDTATVNLVEHLKQHPGLNLADVAYTLQVGRRAFSHRRILVCCNLDDAANALSTLDPKRVFTNFQESDQRPVVFMFSGQGSQYVNMGLELYQVEPKFREQIDICSELLKPHLGLDLRHILYPTESQAEAAAQQLKQTAITQPALFAIEYALAQLWISWGVRPQAMIGHSIGEYVAACLAGVFSLEDALSLVAKRGKLMQQMPSGTMLAVPLPEHEVQLLLGSTDALAGRLYLAVINGSSSCVVAGTTEAVDALQVKLLARGVECRLLHTSHAFHSQMMEPILEPFTLAVKKVNLKSPKIPYISNLTGTWITAAEATNPHYWARHLRQTVRFADGLQQLLPQPNWILLEIGPGRTLSTLAKQHPDQTAGQVVLSSLRHPQDQQSDVAFLLNTLGKLWLAGIQVDWSGFYAHEQRYRVPLPTYPFERQRYWIESQKQPASGEQFQQRLTAPQMWKSLVEAGRIQSRVGISEFDNPTYLEKHQWLERLCAAYINLALIELGAFSNRAQKYSIEGLCHQFHILPRYQQLLSRCLKGLVEQGQLQQYGETFTNLLPFTTDSLNALVEEVRVKWRYTPQLLELVQRCGEKFAAILIGEEDPLELLFSEPTFGTLQSLYQDSPWARYYTAIMRATLQEVVKSLPPEVNLRILEIGAGTGSTTAYLLPGLPPQRTNYTFTDVGSFFLSRAQQKFSAYPFVQYRLLDLDQPPQEQGYESHSFDVVIAAQVLHATRSLGKTLERVRSLLAPEGFLLLWEATKPQMLYFDVAFPLLQPFEEEELRSCHAFLSTEQWHEALRAHGFVEVVAFPETQALESHILVARASSSAELPASPAFTELVHQKDAVNTRQVSWTIHSRPKLSNAYIAPRNDVEQTMAQIWEKWLGIELVGIHDDFFELGGDSLLAVQLLTQLGETLQRSLPPNTLLNAPTIAALAELIEETTLLPELPNRPSRQALGPELVEIKFGSFKQPFFLIHPAGGLVYFYRDLAYCLGSDQPVYGLQAQGVDGKTPPLTKVEEMATQYIEALRVVQPEGPYCLGGSSFGGTVAFEMAQQLHALGQKVALLTLIDTPDPGQMPAKLEDDDVKILAYLLGVGANLSVSLDHLRQLEPNSRLLYFLQQVRIANRIVPADFGLTELRPFLHLFKVNVQAMRSYIPRTYPGRVIFFRASERDALTPENPELPWIEVAAGGIEVIEVPGNHITMNYPPHVQVLAERLQLYLDEARRIFDE